MFVQVPGEMLSAEMNSSCGRWSGAAEAGWMRLIGQEGRNSAQMRAVVEARAGVRIRRKERCCNAMLSEFVSCIM